MSNSEKSDQKHSNENLKTPVYRTRLVMTNYWSLACNVGEDVRLENYGQIINESHIFY